MGKYYVYLHRKASNGEIFYVGKGKGKRAEHKTRRNAFWKNINKKHGTVIEYVVKNLKEKEALKIEKKIIKKLEPKANLSSGGESGKTGYKTPKEVKNKISISNKITKREKCKKFICVEDNICFYSLSDAAEYYNADRTNISRVLNNLRKTTKKKTFKYLYKEII
jgi:hypothetical protein